MRFLFILILLPLSLYGRLVTQVSDIADALMRDDSRETNTVFDVTAKISYVLPYGGLRFHLTIEDTSGCCYVSGEAVGPHIPNAKTLSPGDIIRVQGKLCRSSSTHLWPVIDSLERLRHETPPTPLDLPGPLLMNGAHDWRCARLTGEIQDAIPSETSTSWLYLALNCDGEVIYAPMPLSGAPLKQMEALIGAKVQLEGFSNPRDFSFRFYTGRIFHSAGLKDLKVLQQPPQDPFATAPSVDTLRQHMPSRFSTGGRHRARGRVLAFWQARNALLQTEDGRLIRVTFAKPECFRHGDFLEVLGFPHSDVFHLSLSRAQGRLTAPWPVTVPSPLTLTAKNIRDRLAHNISNYNCLHGQTVQITGEISDLSENLQQEKILSLKLDDYIIHADVSAIADAIPELTAFSGVSLTGICVLETENWTQSPNSPQIRDCCIVVNHPEDLKILSRPSWWTPERLWTTIFALVAILTGISIWTLTLRILVERRGRELFRRQIESAASKFKVMERTRLAVELHDSVSQILTGVAMELEAADCLQADDAAETARHLTIARNMLRSCRSELRNCLWDLRGQSLEETSMEDAIRKTLLPHLNGITLNLRFNIPRSRLSDNTAHTLLQIIRELTVNAIRHGHATVIRIAGSVEDNLIKFSVTDNGSGFDPDLAPGVSDGHFGLEGIRERVRHLHGTFTLQPANHGGVKATVSIAASHQDDSEALKS